MKRKLTEAEIDALLDNSTRIAQALENIYNLYLIVTVLGIFGLLVLGIVVILFMPNMPF